MMKEEPGVEAEAYARRRGLLFTGRFGSGLRGRVWKVRRNGKLIPIALKWHRKRDAYARERDCYLLLEEMGVDFELEGFNVPKLLYADDDALALEMTIVGRPFVLDFDQTWLGSPPDFPKEVWEERRAAWAVLGRMEEAR